MKDETKEVEKAVQFENDQGQETKTTSLPERGESPTEQQEQFLTTLFDRFTQGFVEIRQITRQGGLTREWISIDNPTLPVFPDDQHIYFGVATRQYGKGGKSDIVEIPAAWTDIDFKNKDIDRDEVDRRIVAFPLQPSIVINSGNGYHLYWILNTPAKIGDIPKIEDINRRLVNHFGGDKGSADAAHILRLPGTYNVKDSPKLVTVERINDKTYCIEDFDFLPPVKPPELPSPLLKETLEEWHTQILRGVSEGERHTSAIRLAGRYQQKGLTENEVQILMAQWNEKNHPPLSGSELSKTIMDIFNRNNKNNNINSSSSQDFSSVLETSVMRVNDFMHKILPVKPFIINPLLKKGEIIMISAARGVGKTWFALSLGFMSTRQLSIGDWTTETPTPTLYLDGEMSQDEMQGRIFGLKIGRQQEQVPFYMLSSDEMRSNDKRSPNLNNPLWRSSISDYLKSHPDIGLVILDNLASLTPGREENQKKGWDDINEWLLSLRSKGIAVIFLHHVGKGGDQRGTSAIEDNINFSIKLKHPEGYQSGEGAKFIVEFTKSRRLHGNYTKPFTLQLQDTVSGLDWKVIEELKTTDQIIKMLQEGTKQKVIAKTLNVTPSYVSQTVKKTKEDEKSRRMQLVLGDNEEQTEDSPNTEEVDVAECQN
jgi:hypothetical protein